MTMSACSDDDENNSTNGGGITIKGVDQAEYFRKNLGIFSENDSILFPMRMTVLDALTPTVYSFFVEDMEEAERLFLAWIPDKALDGVSRNGSTIVYAPRDAQGASQGTITFRAALPTETATLAVVEFNGVNKMKGIDKIKFQPESAMPNNSYAYPLPLDLTSIENGYWFYQYVPKEEIFTWHDDKEKVTYYYTYPLKVRLNKVYNYKEVWYSPFCYVCFRIAMDNDPKFKAEVIKRLSKPRIEIFVGGGPILYPGGIRTTFYSYLCGRDEFVWGYMFNNLPPSGDYWLLRSYAVKDGETVSIPLMN
ncbi:hypothetical protein I6E12_08315 [Prevotella brevis]|uniref:Uncharacterized protein n=1 Tax=Xylanibacter brevis TaxID=83231 RepID=A0ABS9CGC5_9BACT|nr:hypothetical protein [Xylanibacter brevis]MCF2564114.1 hypothetical protein [Xylanibacter brevis]